MNKLIIENRAGLSDVQALQYALIAAVQHEIQRTGTIQQNFPGVQVHRFKNLVAQTFLVAQADSTESKVDAMQIKCAREALNQEAA